MRWIVRNARNCASWQGWLMRFTSYSALKLCIAGDFV